MCGIFGVLSHSLPEVDTLVAGLQRLKHRGPDAMQYSLIGNTLFIGHTRLAVIDLDERSNQPMSDRSGNYIITYNGEVYNYLEIKEELVKLGFTFITTSDTEVVLTAFIAWGEKCLLKFNGMWAFAIWNVQKQQLFLARDRFGVKPLYTLQRNGLFQFASELKAFMGQREFNARYIFNALTIWNVEGQRETFLHNVEQLLPGEYAWVSLSSFSRHQYWETSKHLPKLPKTESGIIANFQELLRDACRLRLRSDVPFATALSGGLDSSTVAALITDIRKNATQGFTAFIAHYPHSSQDEYRHAQALADSKNITKQHVEITSQTCIEYLDDVIYATEDGIDLATGPYLLYKAYANQGIKISLDGHGADELLAGYIEYPQMAITKKMLQLTPLRNLDLLITLHRMGMSYPRILGHLTSGLLRQFRRSSQVDSYLDFQDELYAPYLLPADYARRDLIDRQLYLDFHFTKLPPILRRFDRCSMAHGVEIRSPFLDWRVVTFLFSLPSTYKIHKGYTKYILRKSMAHLLPTCISTRTQKLGFTNPVLDWYKIGGFRNYLLDHVHSKSFLENPYFKSKAIQEGLVNNENILKFWPYIQMSRLLTLFTESSRI